MVRLKDKKLRGFSIEVLAFQFLMVRLKVPFVPVALLIYYPFQFLMVRLKASDFLVIVGTSPISIPYGAIKSLS